jgi:hypothetical protein
MSSGVFAWLDGLPLPILGVILLACIFLAAAIGLALRGWTKRGGTAGTPQQQTQESNIVTGLLGLLTLLLAFTFSLAIDRFEARRELVIAHSNAISTAYLRVQLLPEPHRTRLSRLLLDYTGNILLLAQAPRNDIPSLLARDDRLLGDLWSATVAAHDTTKTLPFSYSILESMNAMIDADAARREERLARLPNRVLAALFIYLAVTGTVLGYLVSGHRIRLVASVLMALLVVSLVLIVDIDQPTRDSIVESQSPIEAVLGTLKKQPPGSYDRWRRPP